MSPGKSVALHPFRPLLNFSALQRDVIRMAAFMAMVGDHIATAFQLDMPLLNMAGRCAFPLFALVSGCNLAGKTLRQYSLNRLWLTALLAQPGYWLAFREAGLMWWQLNILFAFAVVMQVARFLQAATVLHGVAAFTVLVGYLPLSSASYGIPGLLMLAGALLIWQVRDSLRPALFAVWLLLVGLLNARHGDVMTLSGVLLTLTVLFCVHGLVPTPAGRTVVCTSVCPPSAVYWFSGQCSLTCLYCCFNQTKGIHMKNKQIALSAVISGCLLLSGPTFASSKGPVLIHSELPEQILAEPPAVPEQVTTNVLLRQILAEVIKTNSLKEDKRCSDGEKNYSPGYIISVGNKTLRCDIARDYPQWIEGDKA